LLDDFVSRAERKLLSGDLRGAYDDARQALTRSRTNGRAHYLLSCIATLRGATADALKLCQIAIDLDGPSGEYLAQLAFCYFELGECVEARNCGARALDCAEVPTNALSRLSSLFHSLNAYPQMLDATKRIQALEPSNESALSGLSTAYFLCGRVEEARRTLMETIRLYPNNVRAYCSLSGLRTARAEDNSVEIIVSLIADEKNPHNLVNLHHALAREYEDLGQIDRAFESLEKGKSILQSISGYKIKPDIDMFAAIGRYIDASPPWPTNATLMQPIFVVGMPRTGTTVTERILSNCNGVVSLGESLQFGALVRYHACCNSPRLIDAQTVDRRWRSLPLDVIGKAYCSYGAALTGGTQRFVNKLPLNLLFVPLIVRALPKARIICLNRHPLDTVLANYRQLFATVTTTYGYTSSLKATATFVAESMKLAQRLRLRYPEQFHLLDYEELAANPTSKARDIVRFCDLEWRDDVVKIENNTSPVGSLSAAQVSSPIHSRFVGRWRKYMSYLGEAISVLEAYDIVWDSNVPKAAGPDVA